MESQNPKRGEVGLDRRESYILKGAGIHPQGLVRTIASLRKKRRRICAAPSRLRRSV